MKIILVKFLTPASSLQGICMNHIILSMIMPEITNKISHSIKDVVEQKSYHSANKYNYIKYHILVTMLIEKPQTLDPQSRATGPNLPWQGNSISFKDGWFPFNSPDGNGNLDVAFLFLSAIKIHWERIGLFTTLFRLGYWANIHSSYYYLTIQMVDGCPSVVAMTEN
ncbi:hypothetical protein H5410_021086 [Solanum commersonii]|uniref:Uncharacterized protein n=1 Tax=Solanum commersonii TaxID=4109 RepID=A0A9J5ZBP4_SOLCO|nr:hypothetical protein H5410_021086 [Solanum commersonii]